MRRSRLSAHAPACLGLLALAATLALAPVGARAQGVASELQPAYGFVAQGGEFDVDLVVPAAGAAFNGFHAVMSYDPNLLTFVQASPVSAQQGCLMTGSCSSACGLTFHLFHAAADSLAVDLSLLCDQVALTGPGQLYRLHFHAANTDTITYVRTRVAAFYEAGVYVLPVTTADSRIVIGSPAAVAGGPLSRLGTRIGAEPNPARGPVAFAIAAARDGVQEVDVLDLSGRRVRRLSAGWQARGARRLAWDGTDEAGVRVPPGVYLARLRAGGEVAVTHLTLVR